MKRILVVEDEPDVRQFVEHVLTGSGFDVELAEDGEVGLEKLAANRPDVMLLDLMMPRLDGWGVLERLETVESPPPVIVLTARDDLASLSRAFQHNVAAFVTKPFRFAELIQATQRVLDRGAAPAVSERRREKRRALSVQVRLLSDSGVPTSVGELLDLSRHGARVKLGSARDTGESIRLALHMASGLVVLQLAGSVRWCQQLSDGYAIGLELDDLPGETDEQLQHLFSDID